MDGARSIFGDRPGEIRKVRPQRVINDARLAGDDDEWRTLLPEYVIEAAECVAEANT